MCDEVLFKSSELETMWKSEAMTYIRVIRRNVFADINVSYKSWLRNRAEDRQPKLGYSEQKARMTNTCWHFGMCFRLHSSAQLSVNKLKEQFTSSAFIKVILCVEIKTTLNLSSQNWLNSYYLFLCYVLHTFQIKLR